MKVAFYTIALNEAAHVERWASSAVDADYRIVADTGSTDDAVERLVRAGVTVYRIAIRPWRFDDARNAALALVPADADVCVTMDMDEFLEPGWRPRLEEAWTPGTTAIWCRSSRRSHLDDPSPRSWPAKKFHARWDYRCRRAVHEMLCFTGEEEVTRVCDEIVIAELQDRSKSTRQQYLPLMEIAHEEDPDDAQICFWLGRDYMWANQQQKGIELLQRYLALPTSTWTEERSEAMRYLARMQPEKKMSWLDKARLEAPHRRETWLDLAEEFHGQADWLNLFWACANGIEKTHRTGSYLDDPHCWGFRLYDLGAIAAWHLDMMDRAVDLGGKALGLDPGNQRLKNNLEFFIRRAEQLRAETPHLSENTAAIDVRSRARVNAISRMLGQMHLINLDRSEARLAIFSERNTHLDDVTRVSAIDGTLVERRKLIFDGMISDDLLYPPGTLGCALSHVTLWKKSVSQNSVITVFEDDVICSYGFQERATQVVEELPGDWDIVHWGYDFEKCYMWVNSGFAKAKLEFYGNRFSARDATGFQTEKCSHLAIRIAHSLGTQGYSLSPKGARALLEFCLPLRNRLITLPGTGVFLEDRGIDVAMCGAYPSMRAYACMPPLVILDGNQTSDRAEADRHPAPSEGRWARKTV